MEKQFVIKFKEGKGVTCRLEDAWGGQEIES